MRDAPIAVFLRETREAQRRETDGEPWSQDDFLAALETATGWHLHRPNYSRYETGKSTPSPATLRRLTGFWATRGVAIPDFEAEPETADERDPMTRLADAIVDLTTELHEARAERATLVAKVAEMDAVLRSLVAPAIEGAGAHRAQPETAGSAG